MPGDAAAGRSSSPDDAGAARLLRLSGRPLFDAVYRSGLRFRSGTVRIVYSENTLGVTRLGFSVPGRSGPAVLRNRFRRRVREAFRQRIPLARGFDLVVSPSAGLEGAGPRCDLERDLEEFAAVLRRRGC
jgi:ribonuclease P protein component